MDIQKPRNVISFIDDDESIRDATKRLLRSYGYEVMTFASAESFLDSGAINETHCIILDFKMPGMNGLELQRRLNHSLTGVPIIFFSADDESIRRQQAIEAGAVDFLPKPCDPAILISTVATALTRYARHVEVCKEKSRLLAQFEAATNEFATCVTELNRKIGISPKPEYDRLERATHGARARSEQARLALERHAAAHGC